MQLQSIQTNKEPRLLKALEKWLGTSSFLNYPTGWCSSRDDNNIQNFDKNKQTKQGCESETYGTWTVTGGSCTDSSKTTKEACEQSTHFWIHNDEWYKAKCISRDKNWDMKYHASHDTEKECESEKYGTWTETGVCSDPSKITRAECEQSKYVWKEDDNSIEATKITDRETCEEGVDRGVTGETQCKWFHGTDSQALGNSVEACPGLVHDDNTKRYSFFPDLQFGIIRSKENGCSGATPKASLAKMKGFCKGNIASLLDVEKQIEMVSQNRMVREDELLSPLNTFTDMIKKREVRPWILWLEEPKFIIEKNSAESFSISKVCDKDGYCFCTKYKSENGMQNSGTYLETEICETDPNEAIKKCGNHCNGKRAGYGQDYFNSFTLSDKLKKEPKEPTKPIKPTQPSAPAKKYSIGEAGTTCTTPLTEEQCRLAAKEDIDFGNSSVTKLKGYSGRLNQFRLPKGCVLKAVTLQDSTKAFQATFNPNPYDRKCGEERQGQCLCESKAYKTYRSALRTYDKAMKLYAKEMRRYNAELALYNKQKTEYDNECRTCFCQMKSNDPKILGKCTTSVPISGAPTLAKNEPAILGVHYTESESTDYNNCDNYDKNNSVNLLSPWRTYSSYTLKEEEANVKPLSTRTNKKTHYTKKQLTEKKYIW